MSKPDKAPKKQNSAYIVLGIREFNAFLFFRLFFTIATEMTAIIVGWQVLEISHDNPLALGLIGLAEALPAIGISLYAGHIADLFSRKRIIAFCMAGVVLCTLALGLFTLNNSSVLVQFGIMPIYIVLFFTGIARGFIGPAIFGFVGQIVPREHYQSSSAWNSSIWQFGAVTGPALGGFLYGFAGVTASYFTVFILLLISFFALTFIKAKPIIGRVANEPTIKRLRAGIKFVFSSQILLSALSLDLFAVLFGGATALLPIFAKLLHTGPMGLGLLRAAPAVGSVLMGIYLAHHLPAVNSGKKFLLCVTGFGLCIIAFAISRNFYLSFFLLFLSGVFDNVSVVIRQTIIQLLTPDNMRGRVSSVNSIFLSSSNEIGSFESGVAAKVMGTIPSVIFGGIMTIVVVISTLFLAPDLKKLNIRDLKEEKPKS